MTGNDCIVARTARYFFAALFLLCSSVVHAQDADLAKKLSNPIANLISIPLQFNYTKKLVRCKTEIKRTSELTGPVMRSTTGLQRYCATRLGCEEIQQLSAADPLAEYPSTPLIRSASVKNMLGDI